MPEQDDKHDTDAPTKNPERRFWRALSGGKIEQQIKEASGSSTGHKTSGTATAKHSEAATQDSVTAVSGPVSGGPVSGAASGATAAKARQPGSSHSDKAQARHCPDSIDLTPGDEQRLANKASNANVARYSLPVTRSESPVAPMLDKKALFSTQIILRVGSCWSWVRTKRPPG